LQGHFCEAINISGAQRAQWRSHKYLRSKAF
jgi:hypothetical protein